jgi:hypothetical protein
MTFRRAVLLFVVIPWLTILSAAQANMPGSFQPLLMAQANTAVGISCTGGTITTSGPNRIHTSPPPAPWRAPETARPWSTFWSSVVVAAAGRSLAAAGAPVVCSVERRF